MNFSKLICLVILIFAMCCCNNNKQNKLHEQQEQNYYYEDDNYQQSADNYERSYRENFNWNTTYVFSNLPDDWQVRQYYKIVDESYTPPQTSYLNYLRIKLKDKKAIMIETSYINVDGNFCNTFNRWYPIRATSFEGKGINIKTRIETDAFTVYLYDNIAGIGKGSVSPDPMSCEVYLNNGITIKPLESKYYFQN